VTSRQAGWEPDVLPGYWQRTLPLGPDPHGEGDLVATLVRRGEAGSARHAVVALHGYTDYFFNTELADRFAARGFAFTSQLYFDDALTTRVHALPPYASKGQRTGRNPDDEIYRQGGDQLVLAPAASGPGYAATW